MTCLIHGVFARTRTLSADASVCTSVAVTCRWEPDPLLLRFPSTEVTLPRYTAECEKGYDGDPLLSGVSCAQQTVSIEKYINANLKTTDPDLFFLWESFRWDNSELINLMQYHTLGGGDQSNMQGAACSWLKERFEEVRWDDWLKIHDRCPEANLVWDDVTSQCIQSTPPELPASQSSVPVWIIGTLVAAVVALQVILVALYCLYQVRCHRWRSA